MRLISIILSKSIIGDLNNTCYRGISFKKDSLRNGTSTLLLLSILVISLTNIEKNPNWVIFNLTKLDYLFGYFTRFVSSGISLICKFVFLPPTLIQLFSTRVPQIYSLLFFILFDTILNALVSQHISLWCRWTVLEQI